MASGQGDSNAIEIDCLFADNRLFARRRVFITSSELYRRVCEFVERIIEALFGPIHLKFAGGARRSPQGPLPRPSALDGCILVLVAPVPMRLFCRVLVPGPRSCGGSVTLTDRPNVLFLADCRLRLTGLIGLGEDIALCRPGA